MKKVKSFLLIGIFVFASFLVYGCGILQAGGGGGRGFFPNTEGSSWRLRCNDGTCQIITAEGTTVITGNVTVQLFRSCYLDAGGEVAGTEEAYYKVTNGGVYAHGSPSDPINPGMPLLEFPLSVGKTWVIASFGDYATTATVIDSGNATVPAGTFNCYKVNYVSTYGTIETSSTNIWYGDGAGIVKQTSDDSTLEAVLEWKNF